MVLIANLLLSHKLTLAEFGTVTGLFALSSFFSVFCAKGQQGVILSYSPKLYSDIVSRAIKKTALMIAVLSICVIFYFSITDSNKARSLSFLLPFIALGVMCQLMMGVSQAKSDTNKVGFFQALPSIGRSVPALICLILVFTNEEQFVLTYYFGYTGVFCAFVSIFIGFALFIEVARGDQSLGVRRTRKHRDYSFWLSSILSASYSSLMAPLLLFTWGENAAGAFGVYLILWGVANIILSSAFNNFLLPKYAAVRGCVDSSRKISRSALGYAGLTCFLVAIVGLSVINLGFSFIWPKEYLSYKAFFLLCTISLMVRPFAAAVGLPFNLEGKIRTKAGIQLISIFFLGTSIVALSVTQNFILLAAAIFMSELIVLFGYLLNKSK